MHPDKLLYEVGLMLERNKPEVPSDLAPLAKERFDTYVRALAEGRKATELTADYIHALFDGLESRVKLPDDVVELLGLRPGSDYADAFNAARIARKDYRTDLGR
jgi:hypothetical protein